MMETLFTSLREIFKKSLPTINSIEKSSPFMPDGVAVDKNTATPSFTGIKYGLNGTLDGLLNSEACKCQK